MNIGDRLKEARESHNISLDDLQESTKIQKRYLQAIEDGNFNLLPGTFYAKAFIKEYALAVGLDPKELLAEHSDELPEANGQITEQYSRIQRSRRRSRPRSDNSAIFALIPRIIVILLIVGIVFVAWTLIQETLGDSEQSPIEEQESDSIIRPPKDPSKDDEPEKSQDETDNSDELTEDGEEEEPVEPEPTETISTEILTVGEGRVPESTIAVNYQADELIIIFEASDRSWLDIFTQDGENLFGKELNPDLSPLELDITDQEEITINAGNSTVLKITINDELIEFPPQDRVHQKLVLQLNKNE